MLFHATQPMLSQIPKMHTRLQVVHYKVLIMGMINACRNIVCHVIYLETETFSLLNGGILKLKKLKRKKTSKEIRNKEKNNKERYIKIKFEIKVVYKEEINDKFSNMAQNT